MDNETLKTVLEQALGLQEIYVTGDGSHFQITAIDERFADMRRIKKEQMINAPLMEYIADNRIHAVQIRTFTPEEWKRERKLMGM